MKPQEIINLFASKTLKKGRYYSIVYVTIENGYIKTTTTKVRFVNYYNIKSVKASGKTPSTTINSNVKTIIPNVLTFNANTNNYLLHCATTPKCIPHSTYKDPNGKEIDKATYEMAIPPKKNTIKEVFVKKLQDVISIG